MARKPAADHPPLPTVDYSFPAAPRAAAEREGADGSLASADRRRDARPPLDGAGRA